MGKRRQSRELALQWLYQIDIAGTSAEETIAAEGEWVPDSAEVREFAEILVKGVQDRIEELDNLIREFAAGWTIDRLAILDRNILRIALFEILHLPEIPHRVSINEAVDLAKNFSTVESGRFVNGILGTFVRNRKIAKSSSGELDRECTVVER